MSLGESDGKRLYAVPYSSEGRSRSLYHSRRVAVLKEVSPRLRAFSDDSYAIVSEPRSGLSEMWEAVPESSTLVIDGGEVATQPFEPRG